MPYTHEHKQRTREHIVQCARELFNQRGFVEVSIDEIMTRAGLTRGGFYNHFTSKEELFTEAIRSRLTFNPAERWPDIEFDPSRCGKERARQMIDTYLSRTHLDDVAGQCPMIALPSDVSRASKRVKDAYCELLEHMVAMFSDSVSTPDKRERGLALAALCVGGMVLARSFDDDRLRNEVREAARRTALDLIE
ncbi:TetR/AcrR family transcriptional regulator [Dyella sp. 2HG41-7]|uniref:TetR/AcrR family transcriptional regulator n=1 Tax=Dyella sp. 2HG41-7 TaxID=2883239 RepID=UPI001F466A58|nr:TetR/AcrR family transcriptional regulator [Dyella sp. 2HG41-7]